ncbi:MAG: hypothetical protein AAF938_02770 [Myxococcota bacterium]
MSARPSRLRLLGPVGAAACLIACATDGALGPEAPPMDGGDLTSNARTTADAAIDAFVPDAFTLDAIVHDAGRSDAPFAVDAPIDAMGDDIAPGAGGPDLRCTYDDMLRSLRETELRSEGRCVQRDGRLGAGACERFRLRLDERSCAYRVETLDGARCLHGDGSLAECAGSAAFIYVEDGADFGLQVGDACLVESAGALGSGPCADMLRFSAAALAPEPPLTPRSGAGTVRQASANQSTNVTLDDLTIAAGFGLAEGGAAWDARENFEVSFRVQASRQTPLAFGFRYSAGVHAAVDVYVDGAYVGTSRMYPSRSRSSVQRSSAVPVLLAAGEHRITVRQGADPAPFNITDRMRFIRLWGTVDPVPSAGATHEMEGRVLDLPAGEVSGLWRMYLDSVDDAWRCRWSFCAIEYTVRVIEGPHRLAFDYEGHLGAGVRLFVDERPVADVDFVRDSPSSFTSQPPVPLTLEAGWRRIRLEHGGVRRGVDASFRVRNLQLRRNE